MEGRQLLMWVRSHDVRAWEVVRDAGSIAIEVQWTRLLPDGTLETGSTVEYARNMTQARAILGY